MFTTENLTMSDLVVIRKSLYAYMEHLNPSAIHVREVAEWRDKISAVEQKISKLLLANRDAI